MGDECYAMVRGSTLRVTDLDTRGRITGDVDGTGTIKYAVSKYASKVTINEVTESGSTDLQRTDLSNEPRIILRRPETTIRFGVDLDFLKVEPSLLHMISSVPVVYNDAGDAVGIDMNTRLPVASFALEVWSKINSVSRVGQEDPGVAIGGFGGDAFGGTGFGDGDISRTYSSIAGCDRVTYSGGYGAGEFGGMPLGDTSPDYSVTFRQWGYTLFPWLKGGYLSGFTFSNGLVSFGLRGARTQRGSKWGRGPYAIDAEGAHLIEPVGRKTNWRTTIVTADPPEIGCGVMQLADYIDGGTASATSADTLDGGSAGFSSPDAVEGGNAA